MKLVHMLRKIHHKPVVVELKNGAVVEGDLSGVDIAMTTHVKNAKLRVKNKNPVQVEHLTLRGSHIRYILLPDDLGLDYLLIDDTPVQKPAKEKRGKGGGKGGRGGFGGGGYGGRDRDRRR